jgi:eukaryotic-like serine/threonine-protein kinase
VDGRPLVGDVIAGRYRIESIAGEGGMGIVYEAEHVILRQRVALKALLPGATLSHDAIERFSLEASAIARIASDHVVRIMDAGSLPDGAPYLVMEYLEGCDLADLLAERGPLPSTEVVDYALQALDALAHAHAAHVIHRDLKPANLYLAVQPGGRRIIKLLDFGISKTFEADPSKSKIVGSPSYMAPEQLRNEEVDARTDIWALGVVMYELLSNDLPFGGSMTELLEAVIHRDAPPLPASAHAPAELGRVIAQCLRRDPGERFQNTAELARALVPLGSGEWSKALGRIETALSATAAPRAPRRFETLETALSALEAEWQRGRAVEVKHVKEAYGATMPAPPSSPRAIGTEEEKPKRPSSSATLESVDLGRRAIRILLVDDSSLALAVHEHLLTGAGFEVRATKDVDGLDALIEKWSPHLLVVALQGGDDLCRRLKAKFRATLPIVLLSDEPLKPGGADAHAAKASDGAAIVELVKSLLAMTLSPEDLP